MNIQGGNFTPKGYMRINAGGSHDENPNGGVQVGVDQNGVPNMLEQGEPVYKDFVYSDNISADLEFLEKNNLPKKYEGWLYSRIADDLFEEYSMNPLDPISEKGANVMLERLANAQEEQKQAAEMAELESALAGMSPEELDYIGQMLAQEQQAEQPMPVEQPIPAEQMMPQEQAPMQMTPEDMALPVMACGGKIHKYDGGGKFWNKVIDVPFMPGSPTMMATPSAKDLYRPDNTVQSTVGDEISYAADAMLSAFVPGILKEGKVVRRTAKTIRNAEKAVKQAEVVNTYNRAKAASDAAEAAVKAATTGLSDAQSALTKAYTAQARAKSASTIANTAKKVRSAEAAVAKASQGITTANDAARTASSELLKAWWPYAAQKVGQGIAKGAKTVNSLPRWAKVVGTAGLLTAAVGKSIAKHNQDPEYINYEFNEDVLHSNPEQQSSDVVFDWDGAFSGNMWEHGGRMNKYVNGGPYGVTPWNYRNQGKPYVYQGTKYALPGGYSGPILKEGTGSGSSFDSSATANDVVYSDDFVGPVLTKPASTSATLPKVNNKASAVASAPAGNPDAASDFPLLLELATNPIDTKRMAEYTYSPLKDPMIYGENVTPTRDNEYMQGPAPLSTYPRYARAIGDAMLGLYDVFQPADKYTMPRYQAFTPSGSMELIDPRYVPVDSNQTTNTLVNQINATNRALRNSGASPSTQAAIVAADNAGTQNIGAAIAQDRLLNEQLYNNALTGANNNEATRAQFYANIDRYRQQALADAQRANAIRELQLQQLNYGAEGQKYAAIANQINSALDALQGIGRENFAMNQINSNPAFEGYGVTPQGILNYLANMSDCGGFIKKIKK